MMIKRIANPDDETMRLLAAANSVPAEAVRRASRTIGSTIPAKNSEASALSTDRTRVSAHGWDLVAAIKVGKLNKLLSIAYNNGYLPKEFNFETKFTILGIEITVQVKGSFGVPSVI